MNERKDSLKKIGIRAPTSNHTPSGDNLALHSLLCALLSSLCRRG